MNETIKDRIAVAAVSEGFNARSLLRYFLIVALIFGSLFAIRKSIPVVAFEHATIVSRDENCVVLSISMVKLLDAGFVPGALIALGRSDRSRWVTAEFNFEADRSPGSTRPAEWVRTGFGDWKWCIAQGDLNYSLEEVYLLVQHATSNYTLDENNRTILTPQSILKFTSIGPFILDELKVKKRDEAAP